jgi:hypothetical protein
MALHDGPAPAEAPLSASVVPGEPAWSRLLEAQEGAQLHAKRVLPASTVCRPLPRLQTEQHPIPLQPLSWSRAEAREGGLSMSENRFLASLGRRNQCSAKGR